MSNTTSQGPPKIGDTLPAPKRDGKGSSRANNQKEKRNKRKSSQQNGESAAGNQKRQNSNNRSRSQEDRQDVDTAYKGRYQMFVHRVNSHTHTAVMQGKQLTEYSVSRDDYTEDEIFGNIYMGIARNIYAGTEMAFLDIGTSKNAVLHRGNMVTDTEDWDDGENGTAPPIDVAIRPNQHVLCQVIKNPIAHKGARLTQEISLPGRYVILIPNKKSLAISRSIASADKKRLNRVVERARPKDHGIIVRTAAVAASDSDIREDIKLLLSQWDKIEERSQRSGAPSIIYRGADVTFRNIRDKFNDEYRSLIVDNWDLYEEITSYLKSVAPDLADRIKYYDTEKETLSLFDRHNVNEQLQKSLDKRVWLPSGGELVIERTEALTVVDVNTARNTGTYNLEDTALNTNLEAAVEIVRQLRLRDIGGIIVIDFIDLRDKKSKVDLMRELRGALSQDPTKTQVDEISTFGIVQLTRKRIGEDLLGSFSNPCEDCNGAGYIMREDFAEVLSETKNSGRKN